MKAQRSLVSLDDPNYNWKIGRRVTVSTRATVTSADTSVAWTGTGDSMNWILSDSKASTLGLAALTAVASSTLLF